MSGIKRHHKYFLEIDKTEVWNTKPSSDKLGVKVGFYREKHISLMEYRSDYATAR